MMFVDELGFTTSEWLQVWAAFFFTTIFSNIFWGIVAEKMGWMRVIRWFGCLGMAASSLAFYYMPQYFGHNYWMAMIPAIALGTFVAAFVPMVPLSSRHWNQNTKVLQSRFTTSLRVCLTSWLRQLPWCYYRGLALSVWSLPIQHCIYWPLSFAHSFALSSQDSVLRQ